MRTNKDKIQLTTILLSMETRDKLKRYGKKGQTYDEVIQGLLENE